MAKRFMGISIEMRKNITDGLLTDRGIDPSSAKLYVYDDTRAKAEFILFTTQYIIFVSSPTELRITNIIDYQKTTLIEQHVNENDLSEIWEFFDHENQQLTLEFSSGDTEGKWGIGSTIAENNRRIHFHKFYRKTMMDDGKGWDRKTWEKIHKNRYKLD